MARARLATRRESKYAPKTKAAARAASVCCERCCGAEIRNKLSGALGGFESCGRLGIRADDLHLLPVVGELLATVETYDVSAGSRGRAGAALSGSSGHGETVVFMGTTEQQIREFCEHKAPPQNSTKRNPGTAAELLLLVLRFSYPEFGFAKARKAGSGKDRNTYSIPDKQRNKLWKIYAVESVFLPHLLMMAERRRVRRSSGSS